MRNHFHISLQLVIQFLYLEDFLSSRHFGYSSNFIYSCKSFVFPPISRPWKKSEHAEIFQRNSNIIQTFISKYKRIEFPASPETKTLMLDVRYGTGFSCEFATAVPMCSTLTFKLKLFLLWFCSLGCLLHSILSPPK